LRLHLVQLLHEVHLAALLAAPDVRVADVLDHLLHVRRLRVDARALEDARQERGAVVRRAARGQAAVAQRDEAGRFWFSVPRPYTTHEPMLGLTIRSEPVFMNTVATSWAGMSVYIERTTAMSSTCWPIPGKSSLTSVPDLPIGVNLNGEPIGDAAVADRLPSILHELGLRVPGVDVRGGPLGEDVDDGLGRRREGRRPRARGVGGRRGAAAASGPRRGPLGSSIVARPRAPRPIPTRFRNFLRVRK
jgi:hypothetical protein